MQRHATQYTAPLASYRIPEYNTARMCTLSVFGIRCYESALQEYQNHSTDAARCRWVRSVVWLPRDTPGEPVQRHADMGGHMEPKTKLLDQVRDAIRLRH